jgi:hypothetical protein
MPTRQCSDGLEKGVSATQTIREKIEKILTGEETSLTTIDLDGVILVHRFTCQRCGFSDEFTDDQLMVKHSDEAYAWRQFGFSAIAVEFRPGVLCPGCAKSFVEWWESWTGHQDLEVHDHVAEEDLENDTTVPMNKEEILK